MKKVAMIGVGKLGQDCAEVMADAGYDVVGYDVEPRNPKFPMKNTIQEAVSDRDIIFIAAPTPHDPIYGGETPTSHLPNKDFDYTIVKDILTEVNKYVNKNQLVVLISTVLPGTVRGQLEPCITNARFIYNPYLIAMGTIKWDMVNPEMVIIGTEDGSVTGDAKELIEFYKIFMQNDPRYEVGTWDEAESIKIFYNTFISTKLALVNMVQDVAETNGNINVDVVTTALANSTYRIMGPMYMKAALGDAGACHPRDNIALRYLAERLGLGYDLFDSIMTAREVQAERMALRCLKNGKNVTIIGKAYKPAVPYTNGSASMLVGYYIERHGGNLNYYDPNTGDNDLRENWTQVYLIGYWESWVEQLQFKDPGAVVIDPWRKMTTRQHSGEIIYYGDTRPKNNYIVPESTIYAMRKQVFEMMPDLGRFEENIHLIDATIQSDTTFVLRPTEDLVKEILEAKNLGKNKFLFFACTEAVMPHVMSKVHRLASILEDHINDSDFIFLATTPDAEEVYQNKIKKEYLWNKNITILSCNYFNYITTTYARGYEYIGGYEIKDKGKIFTCFNKLNREHRLRLVDKMLETGLVERAFYSFEGEGSNFVESIPGLTDSIYPNIKRNKDKFPMRLNITPERSNPVNIQPDDLVYYKNSYFSVVTETLFFNKDFKSQHHRPFVEDSMFLTEKTYRCFALLHPFILMARPYALKELRRQGFKTFAPFIDEEYDNIISDMHRFDAIVNEIKRLCTFQGNTWDSWQEGIKEIVEHNNEVFFSNRKFAFSNNYVDVFTGSTREPYYGYLTQSTHKDNEVSFVVQQQPISNTKEQNQEENKVVTTSIVHSTTTNLNFQEPMLPLSDEKLDMANVEKILDGNLVLNYPVYMDGGGFETVDELTALIERTGRDFYESALDWCSGVGPYGFELLAKKKINRVVFVDSHDLSIETCVVNAVENKIKDKIKTYVVDEIEKIPNEEKFDLVVANPPHSGDKEAFIRSLQNPVCIENLCRIIVDDNYKATQDFYTNIHKYLNPGADVYITTGNHMDYFVNWATWGRLTFKGFTPSSVHDHGGIYHFKYE